MVIRRLRRYVFALVPLAFVLGCAGSNRAVLPADTGAVENSDMGRHVLVRGDHVRIVLVSGEVVLGEVEEATSEFVKLGRAGNYGYVRTTVQSADIASIEINSGETAESAAAPVFIAIVATVVVFVVGFLISVSDDTS